MSGKDDVPTLWMLAQKAVRERFGTRGTAGLVVVGAVLFLYWNWNHVKALPGVRQSLAFFARSSVTEDEKFFGDPITGSMRGADPNEILKSLASISETTNLVVYPGLEMPLTAEFEGRPWDQFLDDLCHVVGCGYRFENAILRVAPVAVLEREERLFPPPEAFGGSLTDLNVAAASSIEVVRDLAADAGYSIYLPADLVGVPITLSLHQVPSDQAIDLVCRLASLVCSLEKGGRLRVVSFEEHERRLAVEASSDAR